MLVPGSWTVPNVHHLAEDFESDILAMLGDALITTHVEPIDDNNSFHERHERQECGRQLRPMK